MKKRNLLLTLILAVLMPWAANAQETLTVYDGTNENTYVPFYGLYADDGVKCEFVIPADQLEDMANGTISSMKFYLKSVGSTTITPSFTVFVKEVNFTTLTALTGTTGATTVFHDAKTFTSNTSEVEVDFPFSSDYSYGGGNLLIGIYQDAALGYGNYSSTSWYGVNQSGSDYPAWSGSGSGSGRSFLPKTTFTYTAGEAACCPKPKNLTCTGYTANTATFTWTNGGEETQWQLEYGTASNFSGASTVIINQSDLVNGAYTLTGLTAEQTYSARIKAYCASCTPNYSDPSNTCEFKPSAEIDLTVNDESTTNSYIPIYGSYVDWGNRSQFIIPATALTDMTGGTINKITLYATQATTTFTNDVFSVYMKEVSNTTFATSAFVDWAEMTTVYNGSVAIANNKMEITFSDPFDYNGGNLLIGFQQTAYNSTVSCTWKGTAQSGPTALYQYANSSHTWSGTVTSQSFLPKTTFTYILTSTPKPRNLVVSNLAPTSATLSWQAPASATPTNYSYRYNNDINWTSWESTSDLSVDLNLQASTHYTFQVKAVYNGVGDSEAVEIEFTTLDDCAVPNILAPYVRPGTGTEATVIWTPGYDETHWVLQYATNADFSEGLQEFTSGFVSQTIDEVIYVQKLLTGLTAEQTYYARVKANCGSDSYSSWSDVVSFTPTNYVDFPFGEPHYSTVGSVPIYGYYAQYGTLSQFIIPADRLKDMAGGTIRRMTFHSSTASANWGDATFAVYVKEVAGSSFSAASADALQDWTTMTNVYSGTLSISDNQMVIDFTAPFAYGGGNLMIGFNETTTGTSASAYWYYVQGPTNSALYAYKTYASGSLSYYSNLYLPKITFNYQPTPYKYPVIDEEHCTFGATSAHIAWTVTGATPTGYAYQFSASTEPWPTDWTNITTNSVDIPSLTPATYYDFRVKALYGENESVITDYSFHTACPEYLTITEEENFTQNFDDVVGTATGTNPTNNLPLCWNYINTSTNNTYKGYPVVYNGSSYSKSAPNHLRFHSYLSYNYNSVTTSDPQPQYAILPPMENVNGLRMRLFARANSTNTSTSTYDATFHVGVMTNPADATTFVEIGEGYTPASTTYEQFVIPFNGYTGEGQYIAIMVEAAEGAAAANASYSRSVFIDDITVELIPACANEVEGLAVDKNSITNASATVNWTAGDPGEWQVATKAGDGEWTTLPTTYTTNSAPLSGLTAGTAYQVKVRAYCNASDQGSWCDPVSFTTYCNPQPITEEDAYEENFNSYTGCATSASPLSTYPNDELPDCWRFLNRSESSSTYPMVFLSSNSSYTSSGNCLFFKSSKDTPLYAILPKFENATSALQLTFKYRNEGTGTSNGTLYVGYMTNPNDATTFQVKYTCAQTTTITPVGPIYFADAPANSYIAFRYTGGTNNNMYLGIDDVVVSLAPTCFQPQNLAVTEGTVTTHEATLTWESHPQGTETAWELQCCESSDFICGNSGMFEVSDTPTITLTDFQPGTTYYARVKPACDTEGELWSDVVSFTTLALCPAPTNFAVASVNAHTARFQWQGTSESYSVSYRTAAGIDVIFEEHFTGLTSGIPTGWDNNEGTTTTGGYKWSYYNSGHDATPCVRFNSYYNDNGNTNFLKTPSMDFPAFTTMILSFWWKNPTGGDFSVYISTDGGATRALLKEGMTGQSTWKQETIILSDYVGASNVFIYFKGTSNWGNGDAYIYLDDVVLGSEVAAGDWQTFTGIEESPYTIEGLLAETTYEAKIQGNCGDLGLSQETDPITFTTGIACYPPLGATYYPEDLKSDQVELYWNGGDGTYYQLCLNGDESNLIDVEGTVYTWEGLDPETEYTVKVRSNCELSYPGDGVSEWSGTLTFTTLPDCAQPDEITFQAINHYDATLSWMGDSESFTVNYRTTAGIDGIEEEFGTSLPSGWQNKTGLLSSVLEGTALGSSTQWYFGSNNGVFDNHARINIYGNTRYGWLITPEITLASGAVFNFDLALTAYSGTGAASGTCDDDRFVVLVYANEAWTILREWNNSGSADVFNNIPTAGTNVSIDLSAYIGQTVKIAFYGESTEGGNGDNNLHIDNVMIGTPIAAGEWQTVTTNQARATIEDLTPGTEYEVVVVPSCDETAASDPVNFTTIDENKKIFILPGDWSTASNWMDNEIPTIDDDVTLRSNATITGDAFANSITGTGTGLGTFTLTIADGGSLACNSHVDDVTMKKTIHAYPTEAGNRAGYYLIAQPNMSGTAPTNLGMITTESDYDLFAFNYEYEGAEWRNYKVQSFNLEYCKGYLYANAADVELSYTGLVRESKTGIYTMANYDDEDEYSFNGWTLVGNPFPCKATVSLGSSSMHYYRMNETGDDYIADNGPINPWEGIFAQTPNQTYRVTFYRYEGTKASSSLNINLSLGGKLNVRDRAVVRFDEGNTLEKMQFNPNHSKVFIPQDGKDYAVVVAEGNVGEIPVNFKAESNGSYTLSFTSEEVSFSYLHLIDNKTGNDVNLLQTPYYTFDASTSDYESRFRLMFATGSSVNDDNFGFVNASGNFCIFGLEGEATLQVIDVLGHVLSTEQFSGSYEKRLNVAPGVYMIRLIQGNDIKVQKMVVR